MKLLLTLLLLSNVATADYMRNVEDQIIRNHLGWCWVDTRGYYHEPLADRISCGHAVENTKFDIIEKFTINFDYNSIRLDRDEIEVLQNLKIKDDSEIFIVGHTDLNGDPQYNVELGLRRADAIYKHLKLKDQSINIISKGEHENIEEATESELRRVDIFIKY